GRLAPTLVAHGSARSPAVRAASLLCAADGAPAAPPARDRGRSPAPSPRPAPACHNRTVGPRKARGAALLTDGPLRGGGEPFSDRVPFWRRAEDHAVEHLRPPPAGRGQHRGARARQRVDTRP